MVSNQSSGVFHWLAGRFPGRLGHLYSPGGQRGPFEWLPYALDNGAWSAFKNQRPFDFDAWIRLLDWANEKEHLPLWAAVPDVVGDRDATLRRWDQLSDEVSARGFRRAFVAQDGMTTNDVPDSDCVVFIGGSTEWKEAVIEPWSSALPGRVHVGRVNTERRLLKCWRAGAISVDGTGWWHKKRNQLFALRRWIENTHVDSMVDMARYA
jgi:hypothetical protein